MALHPDAFERQILAEMRASLDSEGRNAFWDAFGKRFTDMSYAEADRLSATDKGFILDLFPEEMHASLRAAITFNMKAIVAQKLLPSIRENVGRVPAVELMTFTPTVKKLVLEAENAEFRTELKSAKNKAEYRFRTFRAELTRLSIGASGERWHVGGAYTRGTQLRIPDRPKLLDGISRRAIAKDRLADRGLIRDGRNGIPNRV